MAHQTNRNLKSRTFSLNQTCAEQKGAALILMAFILALAFTAYMVKLTTGVEYKAQRDLKTAKALDEAKQAILGWSATQSKPGQLPCPEDTSLIGFATEGQAKSSCTLPAIGRLPWRTLGLGDIGDGNNDKLWYVISNGYRTSPININTAAQLTVNSIPNSAVAIIFSSGVPLSSQTRPIPTSSTPPDITQYLDLLNSSGSASFTTSGAANNFNDRLMLITKVELFSLVTKRILREVRGDSSQGLAKFYADNVTYPYADINNDGDADTLQYIGTPSYQGGMNSLYFSTTKKTLLLNNGWLSLIGYNFITLSGIPTVTLSLNGQTLVVAP
jgi:hypothetical protein